MKKIIWIIGYVLAFVSAVAVAGYIGFRNWREQVLAPVPDTVARTVVPLPAPRHDASKPTVAILLGNTTSEPTDMLGPYAIFAESGIYNVYAAASSRSVRTLTGGLDLVPQLSFAELAERLNGSPDIIVVPQMVDARSPKNSVVIEWIRQQARGPSLLFSWCTGAEVLAESGVIDGKTATAHWGDIDRLERVYPAVHWQRGMRYIDGGRLVTTAGLTSGIDATLHLLARRDGDAVAARVARALHIPPSPFVASPQFQQYEIGPVDGVFLLNVAFHWPRRRTGVWLSDGAGELDLSSIADVYPASGTDRLYTVASSGSVVSRHGLQFVARWNLGSVPTLDRTLIPGGNDGSAKFAYEAALEDFARQEDVLTAAFAAKRLEIRSPLQFGGRSWPVKVILSPFLIGFAALAGLFRLRNGLALKVPPLVLVLLAATLMRLAAWAAPDLDYALAPRLPFFAVLALIGAAIGIAGVVSFRLAGTTVNPTKPGSTSSLVVSGIYKFTRNPMYLGFLLALLGWAIYLSNALALAFVPGFVIYMNRFQIAPEERALAALFAGEYSAYKAQVRRWV